MKKKMFFKNITDFFVMHKLTIILFVLFLLNIFFIMQKLDVENINRNELDFALTTNYCDMFRLSCGEYIFPQDVCDQSPLVTKDCRSNLLGVIEYLDHMPLFFYFQKITFIIFGTSFYVLFILPFLASSLVILFIFLFLRRLYDDGPALLITLLYLFSFLHLQFSHEFEENLFFGMMIVLVLYYLHYSLSKKSFYTKHIFKLKEFHFAGIFIFLLGMSHNFFLIVLPFIIVFLLCIALVSFLYKKLIYARNVFFLSVYAIVLSILPYLLAMQNGLNYVYDIAPRYLWGNFTLEKVVSPFLTMISFFPWGSSGFTDGIKDIFSLLYINDYTYFSYSANPLSPYALMLQCFFCLSIIYYVIEFIILMRKKKVVHTEFVNFLFKIFSLFAFFCFLIFISFFPVVSKRLHAFYFVFPLFFIGIGGGAALLKNVCQKIHKYLFVILSCIFVFIAIVTSLHLIYLHSYDYEFLTSSSDPLFREIDSMVRLNSSDIIMLFVDNKEPCGILNDYIFYKKRHLFDFSYTYTEQNMRNEKIYYSENVPDITAENFDEDIFLISTFYCIMDKDLFEKYSQLFSYENLSYVENGIVYFEAYHFFVTT